MKQWAALLDQLMIGTQDNNAPVDESGQMPEQALLRELALVSVYRRAGYAAERAKSIPQVDPAPQETRRACSDASVTWLKLVEPHSYQHDLSYDWFLFLHQHRLRVPHTELAYVLERAVVHNDLIPYVMPVIGERGRWMIEHNDAFIMLRQAELWNDDAVQTLKPADIAPTNKYLTDLRAQMLDALAQELVSQQLVSQNHEEPPHE